MLYVLDQALKTILQPLTKYFRSRSLVNLRGNILISNALLILFRCDNTGAK